MTLRSAAEPVLTPVLRPLLFLYWRWRRGATLGVRAAVLDDCGRVFLIRHTYVRGWHLPGGGVEAGETGQAALARELDEEAGLALAGPPQLHGVFLNAHASRRDHVLVYAVRAFRTVRAKVPDREIAEAGWFPLDALPPGTTSGTRRRLDEIATGATPADVW